MSLRRQTFTFDSGREVFDREANIRIASVIDGYTGRRVRLWTKVWTDKKGRMVRCRSLRPRTVSVKSWTGKELDDETGQESLETVDLLVED